MQKQKSKTVVVNFRMNTDEVKEIKKFLSANKTDMAEIMRAYLRRFLKEQRCPTCEKFIK